MQPLLVGRHVLSLYVFAALLAPLTIFLPSVALGLSNDDFRRWASCAWQAAIIDGLLLQPLLVALRVVLTRPRHFADVGAVGAEALSKSEQLSGHGRLSNAQRDAATANAANAGGKSYV